MKTYRLNRSGLEVWKAGCDGPVPSWVTDFHVENGFCGGLLDTDDESGHFYLRVGDCIVKDGDAFFGMSAEYFEKAFEEEETEIQDGCLEFQIKYLSKMLSDGNNDFDEHPECEEERQMLARCLEFLKSRRGKRTCSEDCEFYRPAYFWEEYRALGAYEKMMEPPTCMFGGEPYSNTFEGKTCHHDFDSNDLRNNDTAAEHLMNDAEFFDNYHRVIDPDIDD